MACSIVWSFVSVTFSRLENKRFFFRPVPGTVCYRNYCTGGSLRQPHKKKSPQTNEMDESEPLQDEKILQLYQSSLVNDNRSSSFHINISYSVIQKFSQPLSNF